MRNTPPPKPTPCELTRTAAGRYPAYVTGDGRFTVVRNRATDELPYAEAGFTITDTATADLLGHDNSARVWELDDARALIDRVYRIEWARRVQRFEDSRRGRLVGAS